MIQFLIIVISFNIYNHGTTIDPLRNLIVKPETKCNFMKAANIEVPRPRTEIGRSSFKHRAALCWNLLPNSFKNYTSLSYFKRLIRENKTVAFPVAFLLGQWTLNIFTFSVVHV